MLLGQTLADLPGSKLRRAAIDRYVPMRSAMDAPSRSKTLNSPSARNRYSSARRR
jgi:hypothetical protein